MANCKVGSKQIKLPSIWHCCDMKDYDLDNWYGKRASKTVCNGEGWKPVSHRNASEILQGKYSKDMKGQLICMYKFSVTDYVLMSDGVFHNLMTFKTGFQIMCIT
jgi:hypothetical protein